MSGGSYNYLFCKSGDDLVDIPGDLEAMAERLEKLGWAEDAARETEELILILRQAQVRTSLRIHRFMDIWHAVEWWDSGDSGEERVKDALAIYRGEAPGGTP